MYYTLLTVQPPQRPPSLYRGVSLSVWFVLQVTQHIYYSSPPSHVVQHTASYKSMSTFLKLLLFK